MSELGRTAYEDVKRSAWVLPLVALSAYPIACAMFLTLPSEARPLDAQAEGLLLAAASALLLAGPLGAGLTWLLTFTPGALKAQAARMAKDPENAKHGLSQASLLAAAFKARVAMLVTITDTPVLAALLLTLVPGDDMRTGAYLALGFGLALKGLAIGAILRRAKPLLLEAGR